ncbi:MAG: GMP synthase [Gammaproteobacteria bacterium]|nr:MAG: GMP synthase [Gammaproteobacteria bacterium]
MKRYAVVQHTFSEFLGLIENLLERRDIGFNYYRPFVGQDLPGSAVHHDALFLLGGGHLPTLEHCPWMEDELRLISLFQKAKRPVVGIGFGGLLVARAAGARLSPEPSHHARWSRAYATRAGEGDPVAEGLHGRHVLAMHRGAAILPPGLEPILVDDGGNWLAIRPDALTYGLLIRPEMKPGMMEDIIMEGDREVPENMPELLSVVRENWEGMQETAQRTIVALVKALDLMRERRKAPVFLLHQEPP